MRIIFALFFGVSLLIAFSWKREKPRGILETVLNESRFQEISPEKKPVRVVSEFSQDQYGHMIEVRKGYSESNELVEELSYKAGRKFGPSKWWTAGVLRKSSWYYDTMGKSAITIQYDSNGKVVHAKCAASMSFTEEHERVCGLKAPFTYSTDGHGGKVEVTMELGSEKIRKQYYPKGGLWIERRIADNKFYRDTYNENGRLRSEHVMEVGGWHEKRYNGEGILREKHIGYRETGRFREEVIVYDPNGAEVALWAIVKSGFSVEDCSLKRSLASEAPRPSVCP
ncbi:MAG: hypothetical protein V4598_01385 [Bdellovibrionota bacterium]